MTPDQIKALEYLRDMELTEADWYHKIQQNAAISVLDNIKTRGGQSTSNVVFNDESATQIADTIPAYKKILNATLQKQKIAALKIIANCTTVGDEKLSPISLTYQRAAHSVLQNILQNLGLTHNKDPKTSYSWEEYRNALAIASHAQDFFNTQDFYLQELLSTGRPATTVDNVSDETRQQWAENKARNDKIFGISDSAAKNIVTLIKTILNPINWLKVLNPVNWYRATENRIARQKHKSVLAQTTTTVIDTSDLRNHLQSQYQPHQCRQVEQSFDRIEHTRELRNMIKSYKAYKNSPENLQTYVSRQAFEAVCDKHSIPKPSNAPMQAQAAGSTQSSFDIQPLSSGALGQQSQAAAAPSGENETDQYPLGASPESPTKSMG